MRIDEIRERLSKATQGPWYAVECQPEIVHIMNDREATCGGEIATLYNNHCEHDAPFVANSWADIRHLLKANAALVEVCEAVNEYLLWDFGGSIEDMNLSRAGEIYAASMAALAKARE